MTTTTGPGNAPETGALLDPGHGTAIVGPGTAILLAAPHDHEVTQLLTAPALAGSDLLGLVSRLSGLDVASLPSLGCASIEGDGYRLLLRGSVTARVTDDQGNVTEHGADGRSTWLEVGLPSARQVTLRDPEATGGPAFALISGLAAAGGLTVGHRADATGPARSPLPVEKAEQAANPDGGVGLPSPPPATAPDRATEADVLDGPDLDYQHLFEGTVYRAAADVAPAPTAATVDPTNPMTTVFDDPEDSPPAGPKATPPQPTPTGKLTVVPPPVAPAPPAPPGGLIDWVPGSTPPGPSVLPAPPPVAGAELPAPPALPTPRTLPAEDDPLDGATVTLASLRAAKAPAATPTGPLVTAVRCPVGHPNAVHSDRCRQCGMAVTDRSVTTIARPSLGCLHFEDGLVVELDRPVALGRNPGTDLVSNGEPARPVSLASTDNALSRTHAVVQLDGWQVQVVDRDSMNHTFVEIPGRAPFQLRAGEPYPLPAGSVVRLGEEVAFTFETSLP